MKNRDHETPEYCIMVRLDRETMRALRAKAQHDGTSIAEVVRTFIVWGFEAEILSADMRAAAPLNAALRVDKDLAATSPVESQ